MTHTQIIAKLKEWEPTSAQAVLDDCELPLQYIGGGSFRDAYRVLGTQLVIKIPRKSVRKRTAQKRIQHSRDEYRIWRRIQSSTRKFKELKKYLPEIIYFNSSTGLLVMRHYSKVRRNRVNGRFIDKLETAVTGALGIAEADVHFGNIGLDSKGKIKIIDLGLFIEGKVP